jgi:hypothetical protein
MVLILDRYGKVVHPRRAISEGNKVSKKRMFDDNRGLGPDREWLKWFIAVMVLSAICSFWPGKEPITSIGQAHAIFGNSAGQLADHRSRMGLKLYGPWWDIDETFWPVCIFAAVLIWVDELPLALILIGI